MNRTMKLNHQIHWIPPIIVATLFCGIIAAQTKQRVDLIVSNGLVVTMNAERAIVRNGSIAIKGDVILGVGSDFEIAGKYNGAQTIDARGALVLPGFINGHTHVPMTLFRGLHDDVTLNDWLYKYIFPAEAKNVNEEFVRWGTKLAAAEQIRSGVTTFADMYYFEDAVAEETKKAGMRGVLGETFIDFPAPDNKSESEMLVYTERFLRKWQGDPLIHASEPTALHLHVLDKNHHGCGGACQKVQSSRSSCTSLR